MIKKSLKLSFVIFIMTWLSACSFSSFTSYIPFTGDDKKVIDLDKKEIDQKSYAVGYASALATYKGQVNENYDVHSFANGAKEWYERKILVSLDQIRTRLAQGLDSNAHAYYSGVVFAADLQNNFARVSQNCWSQVQTPSLTQGIYDAMIDLQKNQAKSEEDSELVQGQEELLKICK